MSKKKVTQEKSGKKQRFKPRGEVKLIPKPPDFEPEEFFPEGHRLHKSKTRRCQAWSGRNGRQCLGIAVKGLNVCRVHGGASPRGEAHPRYSGKGYSRYMPIRFNELVEQINKNEAALLENWDEIILLRARLMDVLGRVDTHEAGYWWRKAKAAYKKFMRAMRAPTTTVADQQRQARIMDEALAELGDALKAGGDDYKAWEEVYRVVERMSRVQERQVRTLVAKDNVITNQQLVAILDTIVRAIKAEVGDEHTKRKLISRLIGSFEPPTA